MEFTNNMIESGAQVDVVHTDINETFDPFLHSKLLKKRYDIEVHMSLLNSIASYLTNRKQ